MQKYTVQELIDFESEIADRFNNAEIKAPVHLSSGNEQQLIDIFSDIEDEDWVLVTWRSHIHCALKGVPLEILRNDIIAGKSITLNYRQYRVLSSAIAGGICSWACGLADSIKRNKQNNQVWCFVGDMVSLKGDFHENYTYAMCHDLPVQWVIEDNGKSVNTPTRDVWNFDYLDPFAHPVQYRFVDKFNYYRYNNSYPHSGAGQFVRF